jgi:hypothetical protein
METRLGGVIAAEAWRRPRQRLWSSTCDAQGKAVWTPLGRLPSTEHFAYQLQQPLDVLCSHGLCQVMIKSRIECAAAIFILPPTRDRHELGSASPATRSHPVCDLIAIHVRQSDIQK